MSHKQPGLDDRHRDADGQIERKHGNARVSTLRKIYGDAFAHGFRSDAKLSTVLRETESKSLSGFLKRSRP
jgi:hypothetical protein